MKKKVLSLILVLMLLPIASLFVACGKDKGYNLDALNNDFNLIVSENNNIESVDGKFEFDYSAHESLQYIVSSTQPYKELEKYNFVFYNLMSFAYEYVPVCSNNQLTKDVQVKNQVQKDLIELKNAIGDTNKCVNMFAESIAEEDEKCLMAFKSLISSYELMFKKAANFNNSLANLYFNYALNNSNPNVYSVGEDSFDANIVVNKLKSRIKYQVSCLSQSYVEMYVCEDVATRITNGEMFDLDAFEYKTNVEAIVNIDFTEQNAAIVVNGDRNKKKQFYALSIQAQNHQATIQNDINKFIVASEKINFAMFDDIAATAYEKLCYDIVESNYELIKSYNSVLVQMLNIIKN